MLDAATPDMLDELVESSRHHASTDMLRLIRERLKDALERINEIIYDRERGLEPPSDLP